VEDSASEEATEEVSATEEVVVEEATEDSPPPQEAMVAKANKLTKPDKNFFFIATSFNCN
jgi:hypothetical protein